MRLIDADALLKALHNFFDGKIIDEPIYIFCVMFIFILAMPRQLFGVVKPPMVCRLWI